MNDIKNMQKQIAKAHKVVSKGNLEMQEEFKKGSTRQVFTYNTCDKCKKNITTKVYRINLFARDPEKTYSGKRLPFIETINKMYDKKCFNIVLKELKKILK